MKKSLILCLSLLLLLPTNAWAKTAAFDDFTVDLPKGYSTNYGDSSDYWVYENENDWTSPEITISKSNIAYSAEELADSYSDGKYEVNDINNIHIVTWSDPFMDDQVSASFVAGKAVYMITYETRGFLHDEDYETWNNILSSIVITADNTIDEALASAAENYPTLEKGSKGDDVKALQQRLIDLLYLSGNADGDYGNKTKAAVEEFQKAAGILPVTGIADGITQAKLFADDAPEAELSVSCSVAGINSYSTAYWNVNGQEFTLKNGQTKTLTTPWGTYKFDAYGDYEKIE